MKQDDNEDRARLEALRAAIQAGIDSGVVPAFALADLADIADYTPPIYGAKIRLIFTVRFSSQIPQIKLSHLRRSSTQGISTDMKMRYLFAALLLFVAVRPVKGENRSLSVQIKTARTIVKNNEEISVSTSIRNTGETETRILVWACAFPSEWTVDNPSIDIYQPNCLAEDRTWIKLKRGEVYRRVVQVYVRAVDVYQKEVTFRMGFGNRLFSEDQKHNSKAQAVRSNPVTLTVTR